MARKRKRRSGVVEIGTGPARVKIYSITRKDGYPARSICTRSGDFVRHYYEKVGELDSETAAGKAREEFLCAQFIDEQPEIEWWVRNLDRQPAHSFWLQTSTDRFYPDFVAKLVNGKILVVEYKGEDRSTNKDSDEKERLGKLWEDRGGGRCFFEMVKGPGEFTKIRDAIRKATEDSVSERRETPI